MARPLPGPWRTDCPTCCSGRARQRSTHVAHAATHSPEHALDSNRSRDRRNLILGIGGLALATRPHAAWAGSQATVFEKLMISCEAGQQLTIAARAVAEWDLCIALPTAGPAACASDARSSSLRRQAKVMYAAAPIIREDLSRLTSYAVKRGPPRTVLGLLQDSQVNEVTWPRNVNALRDELDRSLQELQSIAYEIINDKFAAMDADRLGAFATSIKRTRELYNKFPAV